MWNQERNNKGAKHNEPTFSLCCRDGMIELPAERHPPPYLDDLLSNGVKSEHFKKNIRTYNSMFHFTSMGGKIDRSVNDGGGPFCFKLNGQNYHLLGTLKPTDGENPKFCQLYIYDTENEVDNQIVAALVQMMDDHNKLASGFRMARQRFNLQEPEEFRLQLISSQSASGRANHVIASNEVAALIVGNVEDESPYRDLIVETKQLYLKRMMDFTLTFHYMVSRPGQQKMST
ncbi:hypothetical protein DCAR_0727836 [Daucus carota subsp. sativus]|uniref:Helitron helicase-like domain-containing protein n=1 Tax=Daucus carota subsp. sativus TaxID=79200 RepID=A0AAF0XJV5_DAUCS|nr:hypothetical protein DCAR_0727836 [Daucus carota subsp. sativus]